MSNYKTFQANDTMVHRDWFVVDATNLTLGRLSTEIARVLRGKHKPYFTPHVDCGDVVVVTNADKIAVTGTKRTSKMYHRHTGYPGGLKTMSFEKLQEKDPCRVIEFAVKRMLPRGPLGRKMFGKLKVYAGAEHPHQAQQPKPLAVEVRQPKEV